MSLFQSAIDRKSMFLHRNLRVGKFRDERLILWLCMAVAIGFFAYISRLSDITHDAFHEMALARAWFQTGDFPANDIFAFTPTVSPVVHHEWGTGVFLYLTAGANPLGLQGMAIAKILLVTALGILLYRVGRNQGAHPILIALCAPIAFPLAWVGFATIRAQLLTLVFLSLQILLQQSDWRNDKKWILAWGILYLVWLNCHAGFVVGAGLMGFHILERWISIAKSHRWRLFEVNWIGQIWHHLLILSLLIGGTAINPWGLDYPVYLLHAIRMPRPTMLEWQPLWMIPGSFSAFASFSLMVLALGYSFKCRRWDRLRGWLFCTLAAYMALKHIRHGSLFAVLWLAYTPGWLTPTAFGRRAIALVTRNRLFCIRLSQGIGILSAIYLLLHPIWIATLPSQNSDSLMVYPVDAVRFLKTHHFKGTLITPFSCGAYVTWECYPEIRVSLDGRYEVAYRADVLPKHDLLFTASNGWQSVLSEYHADAVLIPQSAPLRRVISLGSSDTNSYQLLYEDRTFALFGRSAEKRGAASTLSSASESQSLLISTGTETENSSPLRH